MTRHYGIPANSHCIIKNKRMTVKEAIERYVPKAQEPIRPLDPYPPAATNAPRVVAIAALVVAIIAIICVASGVRP